MNKIICVCGPAAAGKDTIIDRITDEIIRDDSISVYRAQYYMTRTRRAGEIIDDKYFLTPEEFDTRKSKGEIIYNGENAGNKVGYSPEEFKQAPIVIVNIAPESARDLKQSEKKNNTEVMLMYVWAPEKNRIERIRSREGWLIYEPAEYKVDHDITREDAAAYEDFDLVIENKEGQLNEIMKEIIPKVKEFLYDK